MDSLRRRLALVLVALACSSVGADTADDERLLRAANIPVDGAALVAWLRQATPAHVDPETIGSLVGKLGSDDFAEREQAVRDLMVLGARAAPHLRHALRHGDRELVLRAQRCLRTIDDGAGPRVQAAVVRLLAARKPAGAAEALLAYLPYAPDESVVREIRQALAVVAVRDGKPEPAVLAALPDAVAIKRQAAGEALIHAGARVPELERLLGDDDRRVRLAIALALVGQKEKKAVPVLIDLLGQVPATETGRIEEVLFRLAGDAAPAIPLGGDGAPETRRALWNAWWQTHAAAIELAQLHEPAKLLGHTLLVFGDAGRVAEIDLAGKTRWQIDGLGFPLSAQVVGEERVLVAEYRGQRVTERSTEGKVVWEKKVAWPIAAQRLADGATFVATRNQLIEIDKAGKEIRLRDLAGETFMSAQKLRNGNIACITSAGVFLLLDPAGKELRRLAGGFATDFGCGFDGLPNGNVVIPETRANRVAEYDPQGKVLWTAAAPAPVSAVRLPNGNTLAACPRINRVMEVDPDGRVVWEHRANGVTRASRR